MPIIDADAHVIECERTWQYMDESESRFRPFVVTSSNDARQFWAIDGKIFSKGVNVNRRLSTDDLEMRDIEARLKQMDGLNVDVQVLYPSLFLRPLTSRPEVELGLCKSYNRWLGEVWRKAENRLRWVAVLPLMSMDKALAEARFARENGACGIFTRGLMENGLLTDPYYYPLYEEASHLNMPICVHASTGNFDWVNLFERESGFAKFKLPVVSAFHSIAHDGISRRFPQLRFAFVEVRAQWIPYVIHDLAKRFENRGKPFSRDVLREHRLYVTCQTDDDIPHVLKYSGDDNIVIGTDYGHKDTSAEIEALEKLRLHGQVSPEAIDKILYANPKALYGL